MVTVLDELDLTELVTSIHGLSAVGAAAILAETGDPRRFTSARALVKHAGLAPRERISGTFAGKTRLTGAGRPGPTSRSLAGDVGSPAEQPRLRRPVPPPDHPGEQRSTHPGPGRRRRRDPATALRRDHHRPAWNPVIAAHGTRSRRRRTRRSPRPRHTRAARAPQAGPGRALCGIENHSRYLVDHHGPPRPSRHNPITRCRAPTRYSYAGTDDEPGTRPQPLTQNASR